MKKKMLFICAAGLLTAGIASAVESANIVGYVKAPATGAFTPTGPTFVPVQTFLNPANPQWRLGDIKVEGMDTVFDYIQILDPATAKTVVLATYSDDGWGDDEWIGWWEYPADDNALPLDLEPLLAGQAFLGSFQSEEVKIAFPSPLAVTP